MDKDRFAAEIDVSRETMQLFEIYEQLIRKWNDKINLVSPKTMDSLWSRHFLDSAQIFKLSPDGVKIWADFGSGAGFPGLVCAILSIGERKNTQFVLVESDKRKSAFLMTVARELDLNVKVLSQRIESIPPLNADVISARALAPLPVLMGFAKQHLSPTGICLFPKGANWNEEVILAQAEWLFKLDRHPSVTDENAVVLTLEEISRDPKTEKK